MQRNRSTAWGPACAAALAAGFALASCSTAAGDESAPLPFVLRLANGESLPCDWPITKGDRLEFACRFGRRSLPLARVRDIELATDAPVFAFDRCDRIESWTTQGGIEVIEDQAKTGNQCLALKPAATLSRRISAGCRGGTVAFNIREIADSEYPEVGIEMQFTGKSKSTLRIHAPGRGREWTLTPPLAAGWRTANLSRNKEWRRITIALAPERTVVALDDAVLGEGPLPKMSEFTNFTVAIGGEPTDAAAVWQLDDFAVFGPKLSIERYVHDPSQFDILGSFGDQTFGELVALAADGVRLRANGNARVLEWPQFRSLRFPVGATRDAPPLSQRGPLAEFELPTGERLIGAVQFGVNRQAKLRHAALGEFDLSAEQTQSLKLRPANRRQELLVGVRHLGSKIVATFRDPRPSGTSMSAKWKLDVVPAQASLVLWVAGMEGSGPNARFAAKLKTGVLQSVLFVNGEKVSALNDLLLDQPREFREIRVPIPVRLLKLGDNQLEIRQSVDPATGNFDECELADLSLEFKAG